MRTLMRPSHPVAIQACHVLLEVNCGKRELKRAAARLIALTSTSEQVIYLVKNPQNAVFVKKKVFTERWVIGAGAACSLGVLIPKQLDRVVVHGRALACSGAWHEATK